MSNINISWLNSNLQDKNPVIFDIGAADLTDSICFRNIKPSVTVYAFECADYWKSANNILAGKYGINYHHLAVSDHSGFDTFYPSETLNKSIWPWSGSTCKPLELLLTDDWVWGDEYQVPCISLNDFCQNYNVVADFIHIDAQGAEYKIFKDLKKEFRPKIIWAEISEFNRYDTNVSYDLFCLMMSDLGYTKHAKDGADCLFVESSGNFTEYIHKVSNEKN